MFIDSDGVVEMDRNDGDGKDVDEKLIKWNDIFEELLVDAKTSSRISQKASTTLRYPR